jgi:hypothetical protein
MSDQSRRNVRRPVPMDAAKELDESLDDDAGDDEPKFNTSRRGKISITMPFVRGLDYPFTRKIDLDTHDDD